MTRSTAVVARLAVSAAVCCCGALLAGCVTYDSVGDQPQVVDPGFDRPLSCFLPVPCGAGETCGELVYADTPDALLQRSLLVPVDDAAGVDCQRSSSSICELTLRAWQLPPYADEGASPTLASLDGVDASFDDCGRYRVGAVGDDALIEAGGGGYALTVERLGGRTALLPIERVRDDWTAAMDAPLLDGGTYIMPVPPARQGADAAQVRYAPALEDGAGDMVYLGYSAVDDSWQRRSFDAPSPDGGVVIASVPPGVYRRRFVDRASGATLCPRGGLPGLVAMPQGRVFLDRLELGRDLEPCAY